MGSIFEVAKAQEAEMLDGILGQFHPQLKEFNVKVDVIFAHASTNENGESSGSPLKECGRAVPGKVKIMQLKDRVAGRGDVEILIDGDQWDAMDNSRQAALLDHLASRIRIKRDKDGGVVYDDIDRPRLQKQSPDHHVEWFNDVAKRHGTDSYEFAQFSAIVGATKQLELKFADAVA